MKNALFFEAKKSRAFAMMKAKGMWHSTYAPPCHRILWNLGFKVAPATLAPFWTNFLCFTAVYTPFWGVVMWFVFWDAQSVDFTTALVTTLLSGLLFSTAMSVFQLWRQKANQLPDWERV